MGKKAFEWEYTPGEEFVFKMRSPRLTLFPKEMKAHTRAALKEGLLAVRSLFDLAIEGLEECEKPYEGKAKKVEVE